MSNAFRIHTDEENQVENRLHARNSRKGDFHNNANLKTNQNKRAPLSLISDNNVRIQPTRTGKQNVFTSQGQENSGPSGSRYFGKSVFNAPSKSTGFQIYVDDNEEEIKKNYRKSDLPPKKDLEDSCEKLQLHSGITSLAVQREPLKEILQSKYDSCRGSPTSLDVTFESVDGHEQSTDKSENVLLSTEYSDDIYTYLRTAERRFEIKIPYMRKQPDITPEMRSVLIDWLVEVAEEFELSAETLYLSVAYIDKFLSIMSVLRSKLQLVGTACMFIASKYEEIYPRGVKDFVYITDDTYTEKQVLRMEQLIYKILSFSMSMPTMNCFLQYYCTIIKCDKQTEYLAAYLCELSMLETEPFYQYTPSKTALSALVLASYTNELEGVLTPELEEKFGYELADLKDCIHALYKCFSLAHTCKQQAITEKYKSTRYHGVSHLIPRKSLPC